MNWRRETARGDSAIKCRAAERRDADDFVNPQKCRQLHDGILAHGIAAFWREVLASDCNELRQTMRLVFTVATAQYPRSR
jgi:hypothetical protein